MRETIPDNKRKPGHARGRRRPTAALIAVVAVCACTAVRLDAVVIDDFENGVKFDEGGNPTNYFRWGLTNGQMAISKQNPIPTPPSSPVTTYDNVYWPAPRLPEGNLEGGRTLELRMDLNHTSADDLFLLLMCGGDNQGADSAYGVFVDRNEVALSKYRSRFTTFYWDTLATTNENVTVKLAFTRTNNSLAITVKIVDKGNQRRTLYERTFVDGPGADGPVPPPDPHGLGYFTPDEGAPFTNLTYAAAGCWQMIYTTPPPLEMLLDNLEYDVCYPPHLEIARATNGVDLTWRLPLDEHIVVEADQLPGSWSPCPQPHTRSNDVFCLTLPCQSQQKFFRLTPGRQFTDDFSSVVPTWTDWFKDPLEGWVVTNGFLQLTGILDSIMVLAPLGTNEPAYLRDFCVSVDLLDWVSGGTNSSAFWLGGRCEKLGDYYGVGYFGGLTLNADGIPGRSGLWINNNDTITLGPHFDMQQNPLPYRIQFSGVGTNLSLRLLNLTTGQLIQEVNANDSTLTDGWVALGIEGWPGVFYRFKFTVDNFLATGTKP